MCVCVCVCVCVCMCVCVCVCVCSTISMVLTRYFGFRYPMPSRPSLWFSSSSIASTPPAAPLRELSPPLPSATPPTATPARPSRPSSIQILTARTNAFFLKGRLHCPILLCDFRVHHTLGKLCASAV